MLVACLVTEIVAYFPLVLDFDVQAQSKKPEFRMLIKAGRQSLLEECVTQFFYSSLQPDIVLYYINLNLVLSITIYSNIKRLFVTMAIVFFFCFCLSGKSINLSIRDVDLFSCSKQETYSLRVGRKNQYKHIRRLIIRVENLGIVIIVE